MSLPRPIPYISTGLREHKFGIDIRQALAIYKSAAGNRWLEAYGVSVHIGSQIRSADPFGAAIERVSKLVRQLRREGIALKAIDAGGGLGIDYHAGATLRRGGKGARVRRGHGTRARRFRGPAADRAGPISCRAGRRAGGARAPRQAQRQKDLRDYRCGHERPDPSRALPGHHEIVPVRPRAGKPRIVDVVGPVCETGDFFARDRKLAPVAPGDLVALLDAGAYGMAQSSNYNTRLRPAEVLVEGAKARLIRRRETMADLLAPEMI